MPTILTTEMFFDGFIQALGFLIPIVAPFVTILIVSNIIMRFFKSGVYHFALATGDTKKQAKKKATIAENIVSLGSTYNDIYKGGE